MFTGIVKIHLGTISLKNEITRQPFLDTFKLNN